MKINRTAGIYLALAAILWGCGGGGGGGGTTSSGGNGGNTNGGGSKNDVAGNLVGCVLTNTGSGIQGISLRLMDGSNAVLAVAVTDSNGFFGFDAPANAAKLVVVPESVDTNTFYRMFEYKGKTYAPSILGCGPTIPAVGGAKVILDPFMITYKTSAPPAPPTCL